MALFNMTISFIPLNIKFTKKRWSVNYRMKVRREGCITGWGWWAGSWGAWRLCGHPPPWWGRSWPSRWPPPGSRRAGCRTQTGWLRSPCACMICKQLNIFIGLGMDTSSRFRAAEDREWLLYLPALTSAGRWHHKKVKESFSRWITQKMHI